MANAAVLTPVSVRPTRPRRWVGLYDDLFPRREDRVRRWLANARRYFYASFTPEDSELVQSVLTRMHGEGHLFWTDPLRATWDGAWSPDIAALIRGSKAMLAFCSRNAFASEDVHQDIVAAARFNRPILPVFLDDARVPDAFSFYLPKRQGIRMSEGYWQERMRIILDQLERDRRKWRTRLQAPIEVFEPAELVRA